MNVSLKHTRNSKQGKLSKVSSPVLENNKYSILYKANLDDTGNIEKNPTHQKIDLNISSNGVAVRGRKSSWIQKGSTNNFNLTILA